MKWSRCTTSTPGQFASTMNAVIFFGPVRAITTINSAMVPLVHQSFSPFRIQCRPSGVSSAVVCMPAGSDPTFDSVSANAEIAPLARRGKYFFFCSGVPNCLSGLGTPIDWAAESRAVRFPSWLVTRPMAWV
jgi:hypothetical protein